MTRSYVVTGGGRGVGRAIVERLLRDDTGAASEAGGGAAAGRSSPTVVVIELDPGALAWTARHRDGSRIVAVIGDAADDTVCAEAAARAEDSAPLAGWVNNAAVFRDAMLHRVPPATVVDLIAANLAPAVAGTSAAVRRFLAAGHGGAIVNVSSHQAQRPVRGALPYATAKAALEGLTRAAAVDYGPDGIRVNAVSLGSIETERYANYLEELAPVRAAEVEDQMARLHPLGRVGRPDEVADTVAYLLSDAAAFVSGVVLPVDGGRAAMGQDPEEGP